VNADPIRSAAATMDRVRRRIHVLVRIWLAMSMDDDVNRIYARTHPVMWLRSNVSDVVGCASSRF
jgi:hypothetical protein